MPTQFSASSNVWFYIVIKMMMMVPMLTLMIINKMVTMMMTIMMMTIPAGQACAKSKGEGVGERGTHSGQDLDSQVI